MSQAHVHVAKKFMFSFIEGFGNFVMWSYHMLHVYQVDKDSQMFRTLQFAFGALIASNIVQFCLLQSLIIAPVNKYTIALISS